MASILNHVNHIIMPTNHHQVVGKCGSSGTREFRGLKKLSGAKPCVFGKVASVVAEGRSLFPRVRED